VTTSSDVLTLVAVSEQVGCVMEPMIVETCLMKPTAVSYPSRTIPYTSIFCVVVIAAYVY